jgi:hypothetical protein
MCIARLLKKENLPISEFYVGNKTSTKAFTGYPASLLVPNMKMPGNRRVWEAIREPQAANLVLLNA